MSSFQKFADRVQQSLIDDLFSALQIKTQVFLNFPVSDGLVIAPPLSSLIIISHPIKFIGAENTNEETKDKAIQVLLAMQLCAYM